MVGEGKKEKKSCPIQTSTNKNKKNTTAQLHTKNSQRKNISQNNKNKDVGNLIPFASVTEERNALSRRREEDRVTYIRRWRAATQLGRQSEKEQMTQVNYLQL